MTTLADMTAEQREQCVGMWYDLCPPRWSDVEPEQAAGVIIGFSGDQATVVFPGYGAHSSIDLPSGYEMFDEVIPRFDLPRAWNTDGQPVEMDVEGADYRPGTNRGFYILDETIQKGRELPEGTTRARRFVGEWEEE